MPFSFAFALILGLLGQVPPAPDPDKPEDSAARLEYMKKSVIIYSLHPAGDRSTEYRLQPEPILRYSNPVGMSRDGAIFLWLGPQGRPEALVQVSVIRSGEWDHQFSSLSTHPLIAERRSGPVWSPKRGGVVYHPVPGAARPAETAESRLRQMRAMAEEFTTEDNFRRASWQRLRLFARPVARYGRPDSDPIDGAIFCFALGTDPELFLMIEARGGKDASGWYYAFAPVTIYDLKGAYKGKDVWNFTTEDDTYGTNGTIVNLPYLPEVPGP